MGEDAEEGEVRLDLGVGGEGLQLRRLQQLCEDVGVGRRGGPLDEVGGGSRRGDGLGEGEERLRWR